MDNNNEIPRKDLIRALKNISDIIECYRYKVNSDLSDYDRYKISKETIKDIDNLVYTILT